MNWERPCPECKTTIRYTNQSNLCRGSRLKTVCMTCRTVKINTPERNTKISKSLTGRKLSETHKKSLCNGHLKRTKYVKGMLGKKQSDSAKKKISRKAKLQLSRSKGDGWRPFYNRTACAIFERINLHYGWNGRHAESGGEFKVGRYWVDYFEPNLNLVIEYDEDHHKLQSRKDGIRKRFIVKKLGCTFIRITPHQSWQEVINALPL
jgi:hypothetical protein